MRIRKLFLILPLTLTGATRWSILHFSLFNSPFHVENVFHFVKQILSFADYEDFACFEDFVHTVASSAGASVFLEVVVKLDTVPE